MTLATLSEVLQPALGGGYAVAGLVCLGWEDARAYALAAEAEASPVILQAGPACRAHTPLPVLGAMFRHLAESVSVPVVAHLDHGASAGECRQAIAAGFTSVMFDGSRLPLQQNIDEPRLRAIEALTGVPLVIHGGSGVPLAQRRALARGSNICKFNIGTELRMVFGAALRRAVDADPARYDRLAILQDTHAPMLAAARAAIRALKPA